jgi:hypothetical protein
MEISKEEEVIRLLKEFKNLNPWEGDVGERISKFNWLFKQLKKIYGKKEWKLICAVPTQIKFWEDSGRSYVDLYNKTIILQGRLSVLTFLHEFAHVLGMSQKEAVEWSQKLFKEVFPEKWVKLKNDRGLMVRKNVEK